MKRLCSIQTYQKSHKTDITAFSLKEGNGSDAARLARLSQDGVDGALETEAVFTVLKSIEQKAGFSLIFEEPDWDTRHYVFAPAALYNGNRFHSLEKPYPPMVTEAERSLCQREPVITDVPRLEKNGNSRIQLSVGDLSTPCVGFYSEKKQEGWLLFFRQKNERGDFGITITEDAARQSAQFILSSPRVREGWKYQMCTTKALSDDEGAWLNAGDMLTFSMREYRFACESVNAFLNRFFQLRTEWGLPRRHPNSLPWSQANALIEGKYNARNWLSDPGFYKSSEANSGIYRQWQTGWVGGAINTLPGLIVGNALTEARSLQTLDFVFGQLQHPSGFLYGVYCDGRQYGDDFHAPENANIVMSRKNADALYFLAKQLYYLRASGKPVKPLWENGLRRLADAFVAFFRKNGELGQFIDMGEQSLYIGGSSSAGIAPAGLALCGQFFGNEAYIRTAEAIAQNYYTGYAAKGYTNGGPGEILACPDSESAFGLLESLIALHDATGDGKWLQYAVDTASICASWCVSYDYEYRKNTQFYRRGVSTTGAVWASVQNKHAAPGICTLSGASLFRLYRATGEVKYLELCRDIAHNLTQFVSTPENPMYASYVWHDGKAGFAKFFNEKTAQCVLFLSKKRFPITGLYQKIFNPVGRINERVNLSDWEGKNNVGEVPHGSCWPEVSAMLTYLEIPAVYVQKDTGFCFALDHVECKIKTKSTRELVLALTNSTGYDADYRLFMENSANCAEPFGNLSIGRFQIVHIRAHQTKTLRIER